MKLRQKLAMVLASAMIVTAVPVVTMATSTNSFNKEISVLEDSKLDTATGLALNIKATESLKDQKFYIKAEDFKFDLTALRAALPTGVTVTGDNDSFRVAIGDTYAGTSTNTDTKEFALPILGDVDGDQPSITVDGADSVVSSDKYVIGTDTVVSKGITVTVGDEENISVDGDGKLADITFEENVQGQLQNRWFEIEMDNDELAFDMSSDIEGERGYIGTVGYELKEVDAQTLLFRVTSAGDGRGSVILKDLGVEAVDKKEDVDTGAVEVTIKAVDVTDDTAVDAEDWEYETNSDVMDRVSDDAAIVQEFSVEFTVDEEKEFVAGGETQTVKVKLAEITEGALNDRYNVYFNVEGAEIVSIGDKDGNNRVGEHTVLTATTGETLQYDADDDEIELGLKGMDDTQINDYEFTVELKVLPEDTDDVVITASSKGMDEDIALTVGTAELDRTFEVEKAQLEVGTKGQIGGEIVITESDAETFEKGEYVIVTVEGDDDDYDFIQIVDFEYETTGELEVDDETLYVDGSGNYTFTKTNNTKVNNAIALKVTKDSDDEAASITINEIEFNTNNATPNGTYKITLEGTLVSELGDDLDKEFIVVGEGASESIEAKISIAEGNAFNTPEGRMLAELRFVSEAFGAEPSFAYIEGLGGVITVFKGDRTVQFVDGSNIMTVNGAQIIMDTEAQIVNGRTYVPVRFLAQGLGLTVSDYTDGVATVTNK